MTLLTLYTAKFAGSKTLTRLLFEKLEGCKMRAFFFGYGLRKRGERGRPVYQADLSKILFAIAKLPMHQSQGFAAEPGASPLYLLKASKMTLMIAASKDASAIHALQRANLSCRKMSEALDVAEEVVFASTVYIGNNLIAMASSMQAPRIGTLETFINNALASVGLSEYCLAVQALQTTLSPNQLSDVFAVSRFGVSIRQDKIMIKQVLGDLFGQVAEGELAEIEDLEIVVRAVRKGTLKALGKRIFTQKKTTIDEASVRFKEEANGAVEEAYLIGSGAVSLSLKNDVSTELVSAATQNETVMELANEYRQQLKADAAISDVIGRIDPSIPTSVDVVRQRAKPKSSKRN
jgi:hypothetical protein